MQFDDVKELIQKQIGKKVEVKNLNTKNIPNLPYDIRIDLPFLNEVSDGFIIYLIYNSSKKSWYLSDDSATDEELHAIGLFDNKNDRNKKRLQYYMKSIKNNDERNIQLVNHGIINELQLPINNLKQLPNEIIMFSQRIIEILTIGEVLVKEKDK